MHILLLTADPLLTSAFIDESREIDVEAESVADSDGFSHQLSSAKYEGLVLDFDTVPASNFSSREGAGEPSEQRRGGICGRYWCRQARPSTSRWRTLSATAAN
jgi:hypothetical protein